MGSAISSHCVEKTGGTVHQTSLPDLPLLLPGRAVGSQYSVDLAKATPSSLRTADCCRTCCRHFQTLCPVLPRVVSLGASIADAIAALRSDAEKETLVIAGGGKYMSMNVPPPTFKPHKWCWTAKSKRVYALCVCFRVHGECSLPWSRNASHLELTHCGIALIVVAGALLDGLLAAAAGGSAGEEREAAERALLNLLATRARLLTRCLLHLSVCVRTARPCSHRASTRAHAIGMQNLCRP